MRWLLTLALIFWPQEPSGNSTGHAGGGGSTPSVNGVCHNGAFGSSPSAGCAFGAGTVSGDVLIIWEGSPGSSGTTLNTPTGCVSSWTNLFTDSTNHQAVYIGTASSSGACTPSGSVTSSGNVNFDIMGYDLQHTITVTEGGNGANLSFCTSCTSTSVTTTVTNDLVLVFGDTGGTTLTATGSFTNDILVNSNTGTGRSIIAGHFLASSTGTYSMTFTTGGQTGITAGVGVEP